MEMIVKEFAFEAAHFLPNHQGKCRNLHGHQYVVRVGVSGPLNDLHMIMDFYDFKKIWIFESIFIVFIGYLYVYLKSLEKSCMIRFVEPSLLTEGDWLEKRVAIGNKII